MSELTVAAFQDSVVAGITAPGVGAVAALTGAWSAAGGVMVARLVLGRPEYADPRNRVQELAAHE